MLFDDYESATLIDVLNHMRSYELMYALYAYDKDQCDTIYNTCIEKLSALTPLTCFSKIEFKAMLEALASTIAYNSGLGKKISERAYKLLDKLSLLASDNSRGTVK